MTASFFLCSRSAAPGLPCYTASAGHLMMPFFCIFVAEKIKIRRYGKEIFYCNDCHCSNFGFM